MAKMNWEHRSRMEKAYYQKDSSPKIKNKKPSTNKLMQSKFDSVCGKCSNKIAKGAKIRYWFDFGKATHANCGKPLRPSAASQFTP